MNINVNIVIPYSRGNSFLEPCIESIIHEVTNAKVKEYNYPVSIFILNDINKTKTQALSTDFFINNIPYDTILNKFAIKITEWIFDIKDNLAGHKSRNLFIEYETKNMNDGSLTYFLDDDNILHPNFFDMVNKLIESEKDGIVFSQMMKNGDSRLIAGKIEVGFVDTAMFLLKYSLIGNTRFDESDYCADGKFIKDIYTKHKDNILINKGYGCYYNYLR